MSAWLDPWHLPLLRRLEARVRDWLALRLTLLAWRADEARVRAYVGPAVIADHEATRETDVRPAVLRPVTIAGIKPYATALDLAHYPQVIRPLMPGMSLARLLANTQMDVELQQPGWEMAVADNIATLALMIGAGRVDDALAEACMTERSGGGVEDVPSADLNRWRPAEGA